MLTVNLKDTAAGFSNLVDKAIKGEFVTITRDCTPVAALMSVAAAEIASIAIAKKRLDLIAYLRTFPGEIFERNATPSRPIDL